MDVDGDGAGTQAKAIGKIGRNICGNVAGYDPRQHANATQGALAIPSIGLGHVITSQRC